MSHRTRDHERIEELIVLRALGGLEPGDAEALEREQAAHGLDCTECARLEREYAEVAGELAMALEPVPVRGGLEDELALRVRRGAVPRAGTIWRRLSTLAAAAALVLGGWVLRDLTTPETQAPSPAFLAEASLVRFEGSGPGSLAVAFREDQGFLLGNLPELGEAERYELWLFEGEVPTSGGCFAPEDGTVVVSVQGDLAGADAFAVTVEQASCPEAPTTQPILIADPTV